MAKHQKLKWKKGTGPYWVPISVGYPKPDEPVIVQFESGDCDLGYIFWNDDDGRYDFETMREWYGSYDRQWDGPVIAWFYLPKEYVEED